MKNLIVIISACLIVLFACNGENKKTESVQQKSKNGGEKYLYYDDELDVKSSAKVDTVEFRKEMSKILPPKRIVELFGSGYQVFYMLLKIEINGNVNVSFSPQGASWVTGFGQFENELFKEEVELSENYAIIPQNNGDSKAINIKELFYLNFSFFNKVFKASAGSLNGKIVRSGKVFLLDINVEDNGNIIHPWTIQEISVSKFRPQLKNNLGREYYMGFFPAILKDDYKSLKDKVVFPLQAINRGVTGKVLVKFFFEEDGKYAGYQLIKGLGYGCDEAVIKAINDYPLASHPSGERTTLILPFNFGPSNKTKVDLFVNSFIHDSRANYNKLKMEIGNKQTNDWVVKTKFRVSVMLDGEVIFFDNVATVPLNDHGLQYYFGGDKIKPGEHEYKISIDPENVLNDVDRSNNIVRGKLVIK